jgi:hypothetical protein
VGRRGCIFPKRDYSRFEVTNNPAKLILMDARGAIREIDFWLADFEGNTDKEKQLACDSFVNFFEFGESYLIKNLRPKTGAAE